MRSLLTRTVMLLVVGAGLVGLNGCTDPRSSSLYSLSYPTAFGLVCQSSDGSSYSPVSLADCEAEAGADQRLLAVVANGPTGDVAFIDLSDGDALDTNKTIPGYTRLYIGGYLNDVAVHPSSRFVYLTDTVYRRLITLEVTTLEWHAMPLGHLPGRLVAVDGGLLLTLPESGQVARLPLDEEGQPGEPTVLPLVGSPNDIAASVDGSLLVVAHRHHHYLSVLDAESLEETAFIGLAEACQDGLDNDGDGLTDAMDPGCLFPTDIDETDAEATDDELPQCANGLDDDGDGTIDLADAGCSARNDWTEDTDALNLLAMDATPLPCANGIDDDGDGLADYPDDPDCFARGAFGERGLPSPNSTVALAPDGRLAYVTVAGRLQVMAVDLEALSLIEVNALDDSLDRRLRARQGVFGIDFAYVPQAVSFHEVEDLLYAYVADDGGRSSRILVEEAGTPLHHADSATEEDDRTEAGKPRVYVDGKEIQLGYTPIASVPNLGPLLIETIDEETDAKRYYGIEFFGDMRAHRNETWEVTYEGRLPGTSGLTARLFNDGRAHIIGGSLCDLGVLPGDLLELTYEPEYACGEAVPGGLYTWEITGVGADWLTISETGEGRFDEETEEGIEEVVVEVGLPETNCFGRLIDFDVRVSNEYLVEGTRTGYLHNVIDTADGCVIDSEGDPTFIGRAQAATLVDGAMLPVCPVTEAVDELVVTPFVNPFFTFSIYPACEELADGTREVLPSERGTQWRFSVASGFVSQTILAAKSTADQLLSPARELLFVLDQTGRGIKEVELEEFLLQASYY